MYLLVWVCFCNHFFFSPSTKSHKGCTLFVRHFFLPPFLPPPKNKPLTYHTTTVTCFALFPYSVCFCFCLFSPLRPSVPDGFSSICFFPPELIICWWKLWMTPNLQTRVNNPCLFYCFRLFYFFFVPPCKEHLHVFRPGCSAKCAVDVAEGGPVRAPSLITPCWIVQQRRRAGTQHRARAGRKCWRHIAPRSTAGCVQALTATLDTIALNRVSATMTHTIQYSRDSAIKYKTTALHTRALFQLFHYLVKKYSTLHQPSCWKFMATIASLQWL